MKLIENQNLNIVTSLVVNVWNSLCLDSGTRFNESIFLNS